MIVLKDIRKYPQHEIRNIYRSINQNKVPAYSKKTKSNRKLMENIEKMEKIVENNLKSMENDSFLDIFSPLNIKDNYPEIKPVPKTLRESIINELDSYIPETRYEISSEKKLGQNKNYNIKQTASEDYLKKIDEFVPMTDKDELIHNPNENYTKESIENNEFIQTINKDELIYNFESNLDEVAKYNNNYDYDDK